VQAFCQLDCLQPAAGFTDQAEIPFRFQQRPQALPDDLVIIGQ
jgi:hypothetical protein